MSTRLRVPSPESQLLDAAWLPRQWADGPLAYSRWLITVLDAQTALWKDMERHTVKLMQPWLEPSAPPASAQPLFDAAQGVALLGPAMLQRAWSDWLQVWVGALRHDAAET